MDLTAPSWNSNNTGVKEIYYSENLSYLTKFNFLTIIVAVVGLAGNSVVLWLLAFHIHRNAFSVYVLNLAGADFLLLCNQIVYSLQYVLPLYISNISFLIFTFMFAFFAGLCMIAAIKVEHCLSVMWPIWYHYQRPRHTAAIVCVLLWTFCLLLSLLVGLGCGFLFSYFEYDFCNTFLFITTVFTIVLTVFPSVSTLALLVKIIGGSYRFPGFRLYISIALTVVVSIFFGLPLGICTLLLERFEAFQSIFSQNTWEMILFLSCVNSCANPIIYFLVGSIRHCRFQRQSLKLLLQRAMQDTPEEESGERGPSKRSGELENI
ncbi:mas-related G-protein coupled receptor member B4-like [Mastomys coucha]|uniref:mas-related G-protein coupled receptor member B4-like n=1 Tax=Mastomys coucha TaxID=35658 RepID=UPI0012624EDB|nr:mas-related G-protein coupled receptor member B4-like [Mastomys coucha]